ncbi:hypothetical protein AURDEDRAFT_19627, partial [Auricularia subglabra TFB-10046 SS5]
LPTLLPCDSETRCRCGAFADPSAPIVEMDCVVYDHVGAFNAKIQVRRCPSCLPQAKMMAGPDLGALGCFNYNNQTVLTHALLNKYDSMLNSAETTYHGFCKFMAHEYEAYGCQTPFLSEDRFRTCWYSFMAVQECGDDFECGHCGSEPRVVLVDGVTVGYQKRKQTSTLRPPTHTHRHSPVHEDVKPPKK